MKAIYRKRLLKLLDVLKEVSKPKYRKHWYMGTTAEVYDGGTYLSGETAIPAVRRMECGSAACACGWYAAKTGTKSLVRDFVPLHAGLIPDTHFGLTATEFDLLFMPGTYPQENVRPRHVAARVRAILKRDERGGK